MGKKIPEEDLTEPAFPYFAKSKDECFANLGCSSDVEKVGLTSEDANLRLAKYGPNKLTEQGKRTIWQRIWKQVANVLVAILVFVAIVSLIRAITAVSVDDIVSNVLQIALIVFVILYVLVGCDVANNGPEESNVLTQVYQFKRFGFHDQHQHNHRDCARRFG
jgi:magnesium-transporting ATPase (P-type)